jgi:hypothetical protein
MEILPARKRRFAGQLLVIAHNLLDRIQTTQRGQSDIAECLFDLQHPTFHCSFHSCRHLAGNDIHYVGVNRYAAQDSYRLSGGEEARGSHRRNQSRIALSPPRFKP